MDIITVYGVWFIGLAVVFGLYMTWGIGANDVANAMVVAKASLLGIVWLRTWTAG